MAIIDTDALQTFWNGFKDKLHIHSNKDILDNTTANYTESDKSKLNSIESEANKTVVSNSLTDKSTTNALSAYMGYYLDGCKADAKHSHDYIPTSASCNKNWNWKGQSGQPAWLWGGSDGTNMYVYNPSNFSVNYATSSSASNRSKCIFAYGYAIDNLNVPVIYVSSDNYTRSGVTTNGGSTISAADYHFTLGSSKYKWGQIYSTSATISTSDRKEKKNIRKLTDKDILFLRKLLPCSFQMIDGTSGRTHYGFVAQDVEDTMRELGISDIEFAGFCKDRDQECKVDENGNEYYEDVLDENGNVQYLYSLRYEEFIALNTKAIQYCLDKLELLENRISNIECKLNVEED